MGSATKTIMNICLNGPYSDGFSYQENLLSKYQARLGYKVIIVAPTSAWNQSGRLVRVPPAKYINEDGVQVIRIENDRKTSVQSKFKTYKRLGKLLYSCQPDIVFLHGCQMLSVKPIRDYIKGSDATLFVDNHADYSNSATNWISRAFLHRVIWRRSARILEPVTKTFWGVLPGRVEFMIENYGIARSKCELLLMGADDDEVVRALHPDIRNGIRHSFGFSDDDIVVVTGGKIDSNKTQSLLLMDAVNQLAGRFKLLVFGPVTDALNNEFRSRLNDERIKWIPWANTHEAYDYFAAADIVCFPGKHSVYWEQAAGLGRPMVVRYWPGANHIDVCGNAIFIKNEDCPSIIEALNKAADNRHMIEAAKEAAKLFRYSEIAKRSVE